MANKNRAYSGILNIPVLYTHVFPRCILMCSRAVLICIERIRFFPYRSLQFALPVNHFTNVSNLSRDAFWIIIKILSSSVPHHLKFGLSLTIKWQKLQRISKTVVCLTIYPRIEMYREENCRDRERSDEGYYHPPGLCYSPLMFHNGNCTQRKLEMFEWGRY